MEGENHSKNQLALSLWRLYYGGFCGYPWGCCDIHPHSHIKCMCIIYMAIRGPKHVVSMIILIEWSLGQDTQ